MCVNEFVIWHKKKRKRLIVCFFFSIFSRYEYADLNITGWVWHNYIAREICIKKKKILVTRARNFSSLILFSSSSSITGIRSGPINFLFIFSKRYSFRKYRRGRSPKHSENVRCGYAAAAGKRGIVFGRCENERVQNTEMMSELSSYLRANVVRLFFGRNIF